MRPQVIRALVTLTMLGGGMWACATATTGETSEGGSNSPPGGSSTTTSSGGATSVAATSLSTSTTVGQTSVTSAGPSTTGGTTTAAAATTGTATTGATTTTAAAATSTTATSTTATATSGSSTSTGCMGSGITAAETLAPTDGWVSCTSNGAGIQGAFFTFSDGITSTITPANFESAGTEVCVSGEVGQVVDGDYSVYGAGVGFNFNDEAAWNATAMGASGVSFNITALPAGTDTRIIFTTAAGSYCKALAAAGQQTVKFSETSLDCWDAGGAAPSETGIISVQWQVTTNADSTHPFDFCIEGLAVVP